MKRFIFWSLQQKLFLIILITLAPSLLLYAWVAENHFVDALDKQFNDRLALISRQLITTMPLDRFFSYTVEDITTKLYQSDLRAVRQFAQTHQLDRVTITDPAGRICIDSATRFPGYLFTPLASASSRMQSAILFKAKSGHWIKPFIVPLQSGYHLHLSAGKQMSAIVQTARSRRNWSLFFGGILALLTSWFFIRLLSRRLSKLTQGFKQLSNGHRLINIDDKGHDEVAYLLTAFKDMVSKLRERENNITQEHESRLSDMKILAAGVAHEIRNPLTGISGMVDLLHRLNHTRINEQSSQLIDRIQKEIRRMDNIIHDMMAYASQPTIHLVPTALPDVLSEMVELDQHSTLHMTRPLPLLMLDPLAIKTVLRNLIINAREASDPEADIAIGTRVYQHYVLIYVRDFGSGIPREQRPNIFTPFYSSKARGSGLGLAIAKNIINAHHGWLKLRTSSSGTLFVLGFKIPKE